MPDYINDEAQVNKPEEVFEEVTAKEVLADLPSGLEFTNYELNLDNRIFSRPKPTYGIPNLTYSWMYDFNTPLQDVEARSNTKGKEMTYEDAVFEYGNILNDVFKNYPNQKIPEEKADDLKLESGILNLLNENRDFASAMMLILNNEQGYGIDDRGGKTKFGISQKHNQDLDVPNITLNDAIRRYYSSYWTQNNTLKDIVYKPLQMAHFDDTVLSGIGGANTIMKNFLSETFKTEDFQEGISMMNSYLKYANREEAVNLYNAYSKERIKYRVGIKDADKYQKGWKDRIDKTTKFINTYYMDSWGF